MTTLRRTSGTRPAVAMHSVGDFDVMWREMAQTNPRVWTIAHEPLSGLFTMWEPRINLVEQDDAYVLHAELPGMQWDDITIAYSDGTLTIRGEQTIESAADRAVRRIKHGYRAFARRFVLPKPVEADAMITTYAQGVLEVHLPRLMEVLDQQSPMQVAS
jgi:HSP20 family protein